MAMQIFFPRFSSFDSFYPILEVKGIGYTIYRQDHIREDTQKKQEFIVDGPSEPLSKKSFIHQKQDNLREPFFVCVPPLSIK